MTWIDYAEKTDWPNDKIILFELIDKQDGRIKYQVATPTNEGEIMVIGNHFHFDMKQIYHIARYCLISKP